MVTIWYGGILKSGGEIKRSSLVDDIEPKVVFYIHLERSEK
jgi:hypothetical protein